MQGVPLIIVVINSLSPDTSLYHGFFMLKNIKKSRHRRTLKLRYRFNEDDLFKPLQASEKAKNASYENSSFRTILRYYYNRIGNTFQLNFCRLSVKNAEKSGLTVRFFTIIFYALFDNISFSSYSHLISAVSMWSQKFSLPTFSMNPAFVITFIGCSFT